MPYLKLGMWSEGKAEGIRSDVKELPVSTVKDDDSSETTSNRLVVEGLEPIESSSLIKDNHVHPNNSVNDSVITNEYIPLMNQDEQDNQQNPSIIYQERIHERTNHIIINRHHPIGRTIIVGSLVIGISLLLPFLSLHCVHSNLWLIRRPIEKYPKSYQEGDIVKLKVNKMTSTQHLLPVAHYRLPFCMPEDGLIQDYQNLGQYLIGDRIESSPYTLKMKQDMYCETLCMINLSNDEIGNDTSIPNKFIPAIRKGYHSNWIVDNLPSVYMYMDQKRNSKFGPDYKFTGGIPLGFVSNDTNLVHVNNHLNIVIVYTYSHHHPVVLNSEDHTSTTRTQVPKMDQYRIVRFMVQPFSINHKVNVDKSTMNITNPIPSCRRRRHHQHDLNSGEKMNHTNLEMLMAHYGTRRRDLYGQRASGNVLFTYNVIWKLNTDLDWSSRWDVYLDSMKSYALKDHYRWSRIIHGLSIIIILSMMIITLLFRNLHLDINVCNDVSEEGINEDDTSSIPCTMKDSNECERAQSMEDLFRPPSRPILFSVFCGTGIQLVCTTLLTIFFSMMGYLSDIYRGSVLTGILSSYVLMGSVGGYVSGRMYKTLGGKSLQMLQRKVATLAAFGFPSVVFVIFFMVNIIMAAFYGSTCAVPLHTMNTLLILWFGVCTPLVFVGAKFGFNQDAIDLTVNNIIDTSHEIPDQPWYMKWKILNVWLFFVIVGFFQSRTCTSEIQNIAASIWENEYYHCISGYLLIVFIISLVVCSQLSILYNLLQFYWKKDYRWWWRSYLIPAFFTIHMSIEFIMLSSVGRYFVLDHALFGRLTAAFMYFGYTALVSFIIFLMTGSVSVLSSLWFNKTIFCTMKTN